MADGTSLLCYSWVTVLLFAASSVRADGKVAIRSLRILRNFVHHFLFLFHTIRTEIKSVVDK